MAVTFFAIPVVARGAAKALMPQDSIGHHFGGVNEGHSWGTNRVGRWEQILYGRL
jgi:hypothetical protein